LAPNMAGFASLLPSLVRMRGWITSPKYLYSQSSMRFGYRNQTTGIIYLNDGLNIKFNSPLRCTLAGGLSSSFWDSALSSLSFSVPNMGRCVKNGSLRHIRFIDIRHIGHKNRKTYEFGSGLPHCEAVEAEAHGCSLRQPPMLMLYLLYQVCMDFHSP
jgi:hypothetical protein